MNCMAREGSPSRRHSHNRFVRASTGATTFGQKSRNESKQKRKIAIIEVVRPEEGHKSDDEN